MTGRDRREPHAPRAAGQGAGPHECRRPRNPRRRRPTAPAPPRPVGRDARNGSCKLRSDFLSERVRTRRCYGYSCN